MIRVGLVGFGMGGRVFHAPVLSSVDGLELAAVVERHSDRAAERYPGIATHRSLEAMLEDRTLGLLTIVTSNGSHFELAKQALEAGKNVVVDKPMALTSNDVATLLRLAAAKNVLLAPFHNCRWDSDFLTVVKLLREDPLGRLVHFESNMDRWRPLTRAVWKEDPALGGGLLQDLGTHLVDQALVLFGKPQSVQAEVRRERDGEGTDDAFWLRLRYPGLLVDLNSNRLSTLPRPRFHLRGTKGNFSKSGIDPQEAALNKITRIDDSAWGTVPTAESGTLCVDEGGVLVSRSVPTMRGDYRLYYQGVRDALIGGTPPPVTALDAWRVARVLEWATESSEKRYEISCDWTEESKLERPVEAAD
ncbi:MAG TPA: Gfo/Idh/MocA family oxidoreductase [Terracidiphilus sp.]|jgi:predicted dehydrogenase